MQKEFYCDLYSDKLETPEHLKIEYLGKVNCTQLSSIEQASCEGILTLYECGIALKSMKKNKSPGNDGLTVEFYQKNWHWVGKLLLDSLNKSYSEGKSHGVSETSYHLSVR